MTGSKLLRPKLPSHYLLRFEPPDRSGDEALVITSERRRIKLKGHSFREFLYEVVPLLDGTRTTEEIQHLVSDTFAPADLTAALELLAAEGLLEDQGREVPPAPHHCEAEILAVDLEHKLALHQLFEHRLDFLSRSTRGSNQRPQRMRRIAQSI